MVSTYRLFTVRVALEEALNTGLQAFSFIIEVRTASTLTTGESHRYNVIDIDNHNLSNTCTPCVVSFSL